MPILPLVALVVPYGMEIPRTGQVDYQVIAPQR